ncbi:hypothetical protein BHE74_00041611 [Ensete ventricosum]|nr:hypothetical protein GW17_00035125 [Ensete ventricosum]RWW52006.1 hypothetical protein BHE74_00041611 [Ensete ventricosum]RZS12770.1 hypothetical protein BHM03_00044278 [Ensete ventricosum]
MGSSALSSAHMTTIGFTTKCEDLCNSGLSFAAVLPRRMCITRPRKQTFVCASGGGGLGFSGEVGSDSRREAVAWKLGAARSWCGFSEAVVWRTALSNPANSSVTRVFSHGHVEPARALHEGAAPNAVPGARHVRAWPQRFRWPHAAWCGDGVPDDGVDRLQLPVGEDERGGQRPQGADAGCVSGPGPHVASSGAGAGGAQEPKPGHRKDRRGQAVSQLRGRRRGRVELGVREEEQELCSGSKEEGEVVCVMEKDEVVVCVYTGSVRMVD